MPGMKNRDYLLRDPDNSWDKAVYQELTDILREEKGFLFSGYKGGYITRRVSSRMLASQSKSLEEYLLKIKSDEKELVKLHEALTINESSFFRNMQVFEYIFKELSPKIIKHKLENNINHINIWSMGCSTGEEPYSIAYMLKSKLGIRIKKFKVNILATDIDKIALEKAKAAIYNRGRVESLDQKIIRTMFIKAKDKYRVKTVYRNMVDFQHQDILEFQPMNRLFDIILCRNMLIYFSESNHVKAYDYFNRHLVESGYLVLGRTEIMLSPKKRNFANDSISNRVYIKTV